MITAMVYEGEGIRPLDDTEISSVAGGWFWVALPIIIGAGYTLGKDRAERDNARDARAREAAAEK